LGRAIHRYSGKARDPMMVRSEPVASEAIFGSAARRDNDRFSDIDYLIVDNNPQVLRARKAWLSSHGFSVSDYSWKRLKSAFRNQTMFAVHLAMEARVIADSHSQLGELFSRFKPKLRYLADLDMSLQLLKPLEQIPNSSVGYAWALDLLAVAFRNSAILALADEGKYVFSMRGVVSELRRLGRVSKQQQVVLLGLRKFKSRYRSGVSTPVSLAELDFSLRAVNAALQVDFSAHIQRPEPVVLAGTNSSLAYSTMRSVEAELLAVPAHVLENDEAITIHNGLLQIVRSPHAYLWQFVHRPPAINDAIARLRAFY
jgi:hypothetical protein